MSDNGRDRFKALREGEGVIVRDLRQLGTKLTEVLELIEWLHERGCYVVQKSTGVRSDKDWIKLVRANLHLLNKGAARRIAKGNGRKGGAPKQYLKNDRDEAIWRNVTKYRTDGEAAKKIGVSVSTLKRNYDKSGRAKTGRPKKPKP